MTRYKDMFLSTGVYMWFQLEENGEDLILVTINDYNGNYNAIGDMPDALAESVTGIGWGSVFGVSFTREESGLGWVFTTTWTRWALRNGVAPYQPFCICMDGAPQYYATWDGECDVDFAPWEITKKEHLSAFETSRRWEHWFMMRTRYREMARYQMKRLLHLRAHDLKAMYLSSSMYWSSRYCDGFPDGLSVSLCTQHTSVEGFNKVAWRALVEARDDKGDYNTALNRLIEKAMIKLPHLNEEFIRRLRRR